MELGVGRRLLWVVANHSQQMSWSRREEEEESERIAGDEKGIRRAMRGSRGQEGKEEPRRR